MAYNDGRWGANSPTKSQASRLSLADASVTGRRSQRQASVSSINSVFSQRSLTSPTATTAGQTILAATSTRRTPKKSRLTSEHRSKTEYGRLIALCIITSILLTTTLASIIIGFTRDITQLRIIGFIVSVPTLAVFTFTSYKFCKQFNRLFQNCLQNRKRRRIIDQLKGVDGTGRKPDKTNQRWPKSNQVQPTTGATPTKWSAAQQVGQTRSDNAKLPSRNSFRSSSKSPATVIRVKPVLDYS